MSVKMDVPGKLYVIEGDGDRVESCWGSRKTAQRIADTCINEDDPDEVRNPRVVLYVRRSLFARSSASASEAAFNTAVGIAAARAETLLRVYEVALTNGWTEVQDIICDRHPELLVEGARPSEVVEAVGDFRADHYPATGQLCSVCGQPQFETPGGECCVNGHGGAPGVARPDYEETVEEEAERETGCEP